MLLKVLRLALVAAIILGITSFSNEVSITSAQSSYICGYSTDGVLQSGMTGYPFPYIVTCWENEKIAWGDLGTWGTGTYVRIENPEIVPISPVTLNDGTVIKKKIQRWSDSGPVSDCSACSYPTILPSLCGWVHLAPPGTGVLEPLLTLEDGREFSFLLLEEPYASQLMQLKPPGYFRITNPVLYNPESDMIVGFSGVERVDSCMPSPTSPPTIVPTAALPSEEVRRWLGEKAALIAGLETVDIPTDLFSVPGVRAYNESAARELLNRLNAQLEQGTLTPEQLEALQRLTLQERALAQMLPAYTNVAASMSDTYADSIETALGVVFALRPGWNVCRSKIPFCGRLQEATEGTVWRLIRNGGKLAARTIGTAPDQRETGAKVWDLTVRLAENRLSEGRSLAELLMDDGIQAATTAVMIQPYLARTQGLIDKGVRTADLDLVTADRWAITGDTDRAALLIDELTRKANWEVQDALGRHTDFQSAADLARVAEDTADLATLSPLALMAKAVGLGARLEHLFIVNLPLIYLNSQNLECVEYLSTRAAEMAFDSAQPGEDCRYRQGMLPPGGGQIVLAAYHPAPATHPLRSPLQDEADDYRQAVQAFTQAVQAGDLDAAAQNLDRLLQAEELLKDTLDMMQAILLERDTLNQNDLALMDRGNAFAAASFALYLASAETLMAQQEGQQPQSDLSQTAQAALSSVDEIEQVVALVNLMPPADQPILVIQSVEAQITPDGQLQVDVKVINVGAGDASDVKVLLLAETMQGDSSADLGVLRGGEETATMLIIPVPTAPLFTVQVWNQGVLMDYQIESLPAVVATPTGIAPTVAPISPAQQPGGICGSLFGVIALPIGVLIWVWRKRNVAGR